MRIILSAIVLIITLATNVGANVEGQMNCNVKSNSVTTIEEGNIKSFPVTRTASLLEMTS